MERMEWMYYGEKRRKNHTQNTGRKQGEIYWQMLTVKKVRGKNYLDYKGDAVWQHCEIQRKYLWLYEIIAVKIQDHFEVEKIGNYESSRKTSTEAEYMKTWPTG